MNIKLVKDLRRYLKQFKESYKDDDYNKASSNTLDFLKNLLREVPNIPFPNACPGPDAMIQLVWDKNIHFLSADIFPNGNVELFYKKRDDVTLWAEDIQFDSSLSEDIKMHFLHFQNQG